MKTKEHDNGNARRYFKDFAAFERLLLPSQYTLYVSSQFPNARVQNGPGKTPGRPCVLRGQKQIGRETEWEAFLYGDNGGKADLMAACQRKGEPELAEIIQAL